jgi:hypothetical protein
MTGARVSSLRGAGGARPAGNPIDKNFYLRLNSAKIVTPFSLVP